MMNRRYVLDLMIRVAAAAGLSLLLMTSVFPTPAAAASLDEAKAAGYLGERPDGYVGLVRDDAPDWARQLANEINMQRRQTYAEVAQQTAGTTVREVGIIAGSKLINRAPPGHYVMNEQAQWVIKR